MGEQLLHIGLCGGFAAPGPAAIGPSREEVPTRTTARLRVGRYHFHARLHQVVPILDALGVALADQEHDGRGVGGAVLRQRVLPIGGQQLALRGDGVDVIGQRQRGHVCFQAINDGAALLARAAVAHAEGHFTAGLLFPVRGEGGVDGLVQLARGVVRHVGDDRGLRRRALAARATRNGNQQQ